HDRAVTPGDQATRARPQAGTGRRGARPQGPGPGSAKPGGGAWPLGLWPRSRQPESVTRETPSMPSAAFSAGTCRLSDIEGFTAAVSASICTDSLACTASATVVITSDARRPTIAPPRIVPSSGSD